ncbi:MAG: hypothetical protein GYA17_13485, partial [Chloroflexi bacterium]|nr:hypothetical protein [Chloroflexota bacterium]
MDSIWINTMTPAANLSWDIVFAGAFGLILLLVALYARAIPQGGGRWWGLAIPAGLLVIVGQVIEIDLARMLLFDAAALLAVGL